MLYLDPRDLIKLARGPARAGLLRGVPVRTTRLRAVLAAIPRGSRWTAAIEPGQTPRLVIAWGGGGHRGGLRLHALGRSSKGISDLAALARRPVAAWWTRDPADYPHPIPKNLREVARRIGLRRSQHSRAEILSAIAAHLTADVEPELLPAPEQPEHD